MKRALFLLMTLILLAGSSLGEEEKLSFTVRHGSRNSPKIAITVDDAFDLDYVWKIRDLFKDTGIVGTFFPIGRMLHEENRADWQLVLDYGNEIGSHSNGHVSLGKSDTWGIIFSLGYFQQNLDAALGYHYQVNSFRPPFGTIEAEDGSRQWAINAIRRFGYEHIILWDVSQTDPKQALKKVQNGSILLFHARSKDFHCLEELIPALLEAGYEPVTVSDLLGFGPHEISEEPYVFDKKNY